MNSNTSDKELCRDETDFMDRFISLSRGISRLEEIGTLKTYPKKTILAKPGDTPDHCYIVKSGRVIAYENSLSGDLRIYNFMEPGSLFLEDRATGYGRRCTVYLPLQGGQHGLLVRCADPQPPLAGDTL